MAGADTERNSRREEGPIWSSLRTSQDALGPAQLFQAFLWLHRQTPEIQGAPAGFNPFVLLDAEDLADLLEDLFCAVGLAGALQALQQVRTLLKQVTSCQ